MVAEMKSQGINTSLGFIQLLLRYFSLKQSGGPTDQHCHPQSPVASTAKDLVDHGWPWLPTPAPHHPCGVSVKFLSVFFLIKCSQECFHTQTERHRCHQGSIMSHIWCTSVARHENQSEVSKKEGWKKEKRGGRGVQCAVCYLGLISCLTEHSKMERQREQWRESKATTEFLGKFTTELLTTTQLIKLL